MMFKIGGNLFSERWTGPLLNPKQMPDLVTYVPEAFQQRNSLAIHQIHHYITNQMHSNIEMNSLYHVLTWGDGIRPCRVIRTDAERAEVSLVVAEDGSAWPPA
jgi:hypothetical protein